MSILFGHLPEEQRAYWVRFKRQGDLAARDALIRMNLRLAYSIYHRKKGAYPPHNEDDALQVAVVALVESVDNYDPYRADKAKFSTYATHHISWKLFNFCKLEADKARRAVHSISLEDLNERPHLIPTTSFRQLEEEELQQWSIEGVCRVVRGEVSPEDYQIFRMRFLEERTPRVIARLLLLETAYVSSRVKHLRQLLREILIDLEIVKP